MRICTTPLTTCKFPQHQRTCVQHTSVQTVSAWAEMCAAHTMMLVTVCVRTFLSKVVESDQERDSASHTEHYYILCACRVCLFGCDLLRSKTSSVLMRSSGLVRGSCVSGSPWSCSDSDRNIKKTRIACAVVEDKHTRLLLTEFIIFIFTLETWQSDVTWWCCFWHSQTMWCILYLL